MKNIVEEIDLLITKIKLEEGSPWFRMGPQKKKKGKKEKMPLSSNNIPRKEETSKCCSEHGHTAGEPKEGEAASPGGTALGCLLTPR